MKFCTYNSTPGLDRYLVGQRYQVWRDAHKELMRTDLEYRQANQRFTFQMIASTLACVIIGPAFTFFQRRAPDDIVLQVLSIVVPLAVYVVYAFYLVYASFRFQNFQNERVGRVLQKAI